MSHSVSPLHNELLNQVLGRTRPNDPNTTLMKQWGDKQSPQHYDTGYNRMLNLYSQIMVIALIIFVIICTHVVIDNVHLVQYNVHSVCDIIYGVCYLFRDWVFRTK